MPLARYVRARNWRNLLVEADATLRSRGLPLVRGADACRITPDELKAQGVLSESEFAAQKAKILAG